MKKLYSTIFRLLNPMQRRFRAARPESVLILVVALLVLLALIGTAWMSTVRIERYASSQNIANTEIDLLVEGVKNIAQSVIVSDLYDAAGAFKPNDSSVVSTVAAPQTYGNFDWPQIETVVAPYPPGPADRYLASRIPLKESNGTTFAWPAITLLPD